jgi:hypothetical protein
MRVLMVGLAGFIAALAADVLIDGSASAAPRGPRPWCIRHGGGMMDCSYYNFEQCRASASGVGGFCTPNPALQWERQRQR